MIESSSPALTPEAPRWRYVSASVRGTSHLRADLPCQDAVCVDELDTSLGSVLLIVVSDGAGSAAHAELGSRATCDAIAAEARDYLRAGRRVGAITRQVIDQWCVGALRWLATLAEEHDAPTRDFACTLIGAVVSPDATAYFQLGDGAIVVSSGDEYAPVFWPQNGEYANTTYFITDAEALTLVQFAVRDTPSEIAMFSDGIQNLALRNVERIAHSPFFRKIFEPLRTVAAGRNATLEKGLESFLESPIVNERTDDDKSLVLASRTQLQTDETRLGAVNMPDHGSPTSANGTAE